MNSFFTFLAQVLEAIEDELEVKLATIHEIESYPNAMSDGWVMHINDERLVEMKMRRDSKPDVRFSAYYSDFDYLFRPERAQAEEASQI
jgi:hypothetical protein